MKKKDEGLDVLTYFLLLILFLPVVWIQLETKIENRKKRNEDRIRKHEIYSRITRKSSFTITLEEKIKNCYEQLQTNYQLPKINPEDNELKILAREHIACKEKLKTK